MGKKKNNTKDLPMTLESNIPNIGDLYSKLESFGEFYTHLERTLFQTLFEAEALNQELRKNLKAQFMREYGIQGRIFNALWVNAKGKLDSYKELLKFNESQTKSKIKDLKSKVNKLEKEIKDRKRKHGKGFIELKPHEVFERESKVSRLKKKLNRLENKTSREGYTFGSYSLERKQYTDPKYIQNHELWLSEWRRKRNHHFYLLGSKDEPNKNQHCQYKLQDDGLELLQITLPYCLETFLGKHLEVPVKFNSYSDKKNERYYSYFKEALQQGVAFSYNFVKRENGNWYVLVSFSLKKEVKDFHQGYIGVDLNYDLVATSSCNHQGNYLGFKEYSYESEGKTTDQIRNELSLIVKDIVTRAKNSGFGIVIENLDFTKLKQKSRVKKTNRKLNLIQHSIFRQLLESRCLKQGIKLKIVNPSYSSIIGRNKYSKKFGIGVHSSAAFVLARRGFRFKEKLPNQMIGVLRRGEAPKSEGTFLRALRFRHHWSSWAFLSKNLEECLKRINYKIREDSVDTGGILPEGIDMNYLRTRFNPEKKSFLLRYLGDLSHG